MSKTQNADLPVNEAGQTFHLGASIEPGTLPPYCLVVGSKARARHIAESFLGEHRHVSPGGREEYDAYVGSFAGVPMAVAVHGMASGNAITLFNEMHASGARRFIRVGSCSSMRPEARPGDIAILQAAIRFDGASDELVDPHVPAVATHHVADALLNAAVERDNKAHFGIGATTIGFYEGQGRPSVSGYVNPAMVQRMELLKALQVVSIEMEAATLLTWALVNGAEAGVVLAIYANRSKPEGELVEKAGDDKAISTALNAMIYLARSHPIEVATQS